MPAWLAGSKRGKTFLSKAYNSLRKALNFLHEVHNSQFNSLRKAHNSLHVVHNSLRKALNFQFNSLVNFGNFSN